MKRKKTVDRRPCVPLWYAIPLTLRCTMKVIYGDGAAGTHPAVALSLDQEEGAAHQAMWYNVPPDVVSETERVTRQAVAGPPTPDHLHRLAWEAAYSTLQRLLGEGCTKDCQCLAPLCQVTRARCPCRRCEEERGL